MSILGRVIHANIRELYGGCHLDRLSLPRFGDLVRSRSGPEQMVYAVIADISYPPDPMIRQLARTEQVDEQVIADSRFNRVVTAEIFAVVVGYIEGRTITHRLPMHPPSVLEPIESCELAEQAVFTTSQSLDYLGLLVSRGDLPIFDLLASHVELMDKAHRSVGQTDWIVQAQHVLNALLKNQPDLSLRLMRTWSAGSGR